MDSRKGWLDGARPVGADSSRTRFQCRLLRWGSWTLLLPLLILLGFTVSPEARGAVLGDVDADGAVTIQDVVRIVNHVQARQLLAAEAQFMADVNQDGLITADDATQLAKTIVTQGPLASPSLNRIRETSPSPGESDVAVTREAVLRLVRPLAAGGVVTTERFYAEFGGRRILSRVELATDRRTLTLFYLEPLPGGARIRVSLDSAGLVDVLGQPLDADGDGLPGGVGVLEFSTLSLSPLPQTAVAGRVFASELASNGDPDVALNIPLAGVTITVDGQEETMRTVTDAFGNFRLEPVPAGEFFVHIDGRTATRSPAHNFPQGAYYPFVGKKWQASAGEEVNVGNIYLPLVADGTLQPVSTTQDTIVTFAPTVLQQYPELEGVSVTVPANALFSDNGNRGGRVGIAPVPPDRIPSPLPPGLNLPLVITVQTDGPGNFDRPVPVCFPNLPDPATGKLLAAGEKSALWSFNHDLGDWEIVGPMTVSADGNLICSDPGVGLLQPGWHGTAPGTTARGGRMVTQPGTRTRQGCTACQPSNPTDPVQLFSGEFIDSSTDLFLRGRGMDFSWQRTYRSLLGERTAMGHHWDYTFNIWLEPQGSNIVVHPGTGRSDEYHLQRNGTYVAEGYFQELSRNPDGGFTLLFEDKRQWQFNPLNHPAGPGRLSAMADRFGNRIRFAYDASGRLAEIIDTLDRSIRIVHNAEGLIESLTDFAGRTVRYEYYDGSEPGGSAGDLKAVISPPVTGTPNGNDFPEGKRTTYTYTTGFADERLNHNLLTITDGRRNHPEDPTFATGPYLLNIYAPTTDPEDPLFDRVIRQIWGGGTIDMAYVPLLPSLPNGGLTMKTIVNDRNGHVREYFFDDLNRMARERTFTGQADPQQPTTDLANRPQAPLRPEDPEFFETVYEWDPDSLLKRTIHPNGNATEYVYEKDLRASPHPRSRGNLRILRQLPGVHQPAGDQVTLERRFEYDTDFLGGCCGFNLVTRITDPRGFATIYQYDALGRLTRVQHPNPNAEETFTYNEFGQVTSHVHPPNGSNHRTRTEYVYHTEGPSRGYLHQQIADADNLRLTTTYEYDSRGNVIRAFDPKGNDWQTVYTSLDQVARQISPRITSDSEVRYVTDFAYDANNNLVRVDVENRDERGVLRPNRQLTTLHHFDVLDNLIRSETEVEEGRSIAVEYAYDLNRNLILTRTAEAVAGRQPLNITRRQYDERDLLYRTTRAPGDPKQTTVQFDYDRNGNVVRTFNGLENEPRETRFTYDGFNRLVATMDPMGNVQTVSYDANGNPVSETALGELRDAPGFAANVRLAEARTTYDAMNQPTAIELAWFRPPDGSPLGEGRITTRTEYAPNSQVVRIINANGHASTLAYDTANRPVLVTDMKGNQTRFEYNANSSAVRIVDIEKGAPGSPDRSYQVDYAFDSLERQVAVTDNAGSTARYEYDSRGLRARAIDPLGNVTAFEYDGAGRPVATTRYLTSDGTAQGTPAGTVTTRVTWDDNSRPTERFDPNGNVLRYAYDSLDRPNAIAYADGTVARIDLDVHGNETRQTDPNGTTTTSTFDALDRLTARTVAPGPGVARAALQTQFVYDGLSRVVEAANDHAVVQRVYDSLSRMLAETMNGQTVQAAHDPLGNVVMTRYPGGRALRYTYDELERLATVEDDAGILARYAYEGRRRAVSREYRNGTRTEYAHDAVKRIEQLVHGTVGGAPPFHAQRYAWDAVGNKRSATDLPASGTTRRFAYDSLYRLTESAATTAARTLATQYEFDPAGNWTRKQTELGTTAITMDASATGPADAAMNQYTFVGGEQRTYDGKGNLVTVASPGTPGRRFEFDAHDQLVLAEVDGTTARYAYDPFGRRIRKDVQTNPPQTTLYFYAGPVVCEEQDASNKTVATYTYGRFIDERLSRQAQGEEFFYHGDDLHNVVALTGPRGEVVERYVYDDYGDVAFFDAQNQPLSQSRVGNTYLFQGRPLDPETGLYEFRTRYLDPRVGRFISRDAIGIWGDAANLGNGSAFVGNNPWTRIDPWGLGTRSNRSPWERFNDWIDSNPYGLGYVKAFGQLLPDSIVTGSVTLANAATLGQSTTISEAAAQAQDQMGLTQGERTALKVTAGVAVAAAAAAVAVEAAPLVAEGASAAYTAAGNAMLSTSVRVLGAQGTLRAGQLAVGAGGAVVGAYGGSGGVAPSAPSSAASGALRAAQRMAERTAAPTANAAGQTVTRAATRLANMRLEREVVRELNATGTAVGKTTAAIIESGAARLRFVREIVTPAGGRAAGVNRHAAPDVLELSLRGNRDLRQLAGTAAHETCHWVQRSVGSMTSQTYNLLHEVEAYMWQKVVDPRLFQGSVWRMYQYISRNYQGVPNAPPAGNPVQVLPFPNSATGSLVR